MRTGTRRYHCILVQTFGMEFYPYDVKQHVKSAAKQIPERDLSSGKQVPYNPVIPSVKLIRLKTWLLTKPRLLQSTQ